MSLSTARVSTSERSANPDRLIVMPVGDRHRLPAVIQALKAVHDEIRDRDRRGHQGLSTPLDIPFRSRREALEIRAGLVTELEEAGFDDVRVRWIFGEFDVSLSWAGALS